MPRYGGTEPHREAMGLLSRCCGVVATLSTWLTSSWRSSASVVMHYVTPQTQSRLASPKVLERRAGAVALDELETILLPDWQVSAIHKIHIRYFMKYNYDIQNVSLTGPPSIFQAKAPLIIVAIPEPLIIVIQTIPCVKMVPPSVMVAQPNKLQRERHPNPAGYPTSVRIDVTSKNRWRKRSRAQSCAPGDLT